MPLILKRKLKNLRFFALFGFATISYISSVIVVYAFIPSTNNFGQNFLKISYIKPIGVLSSFPLFIFSYTCQQNVLAAFEELNAPTPRRMQKVITRQLFLCTILYTFVGIYGYFTYPEVSADQKGNFLTLYDMSSHVPVLIGVLVLTFSIFVAEPYNIKPAKDGLF